MLEKTTHYKSMLEKTTKWAKINIQPVERLDEF